MGREVGITVLRVLGTRVGKRVPCGNFLGQEFEQVVVDVTIQEGSKKPKGREGGGGEALTLGGLGWSGVFWAVVTRERHLWGAHGCFNSGDLGHFIWGQTGITRGGSL